ncbi:hypothetical protein OROHE_001625 [Orobanche hederae]
MDESYFRKNYSAMAAAAAAAEDEGEDDGGFEGDEAEGSDDRDAEERPMPWTSHTSGRITQLWQLQQLQLRMKGKKMMEDLRGMKRREATIGMRRRKW